MKLVIHAGYINCWWVSEAKQSVARACQSIKVPQQLLAPEVINIRRSVSEMKHEPSSYVCTLLYTTNTCCARD